MKISQNIFEKSISFFKNNKIQWAISEVGFIVVGQSTEGENKELFFQSEFDDKFPELTMNFSFRLAQEPTMLDLVGVVYFISNCRYGMTYLVGNEPFFIEGTLDMSKCFAEEKVTIKDLPIVMAIEQMQKEGQKAKGKIKKMIEDQDNEGEEWKNQD